MLKLIAPVVLALPFLAACTPEPAAVVDVMDVCDILAFYDADGVQSGVDPQVIPVDANNDGRVIFCAVLP